MRIIAVRHTRVAVEPGVCYGQSDVALQSTFASEATAVASWLRELMNDDDSYVIYSSPLSRCRLLAEACGFYDYICDNRLLEMNFGRWEMMRFEDITDPQLQQWYDDWQHVTPTGGESFVDHHQRVREFVDSLSDLDADTIVIFTHAGVINHLRLIYGRTSVDSMFADQPDYGSITVLSDADSGKSHKCHGEQAGT